MNCLATAKPQKIKKMKNDSVNNALEIVLVAMSYCMLKCFKYSEDKVMKIHEKIEWYANICLDNEEKEITYETYTEILKDDYNFTINFNKRNLVGLAKAEMIEASSQNSSMLWILTIVAYILFDKFGLNKNRVTTIMKRIQYHTSLMTENKKTVQQYKDILKKEFDCEFDFRGM
jgi:hypothetical protein